jgi:hypothetical protein
MVVPLRGSTDSALGGNCNGCGERKKQIPRGNDRRKATAEARATAKAKARQEPIQGSFALLEDDGEKQATAMAETSNSNGNAVG